MSETMKQLSHELNISPQAVRHRMAKISGFAKKHTSIIDHRLIIDDSGVNFLKKHNYIRYSGKTRKYDYSNLLIKQLQGDLKHERKQNDDLNKENSHLTILLEQSNQSNQTLLKYTRPVNQHFKNQSSNKPKHHGWLWKLFH